CELEAEAAGAPDGRPAPHRVADHAFDPRVPARDDATVDADAAALEESEAVVVPGVFPAVQHAQAERARRALIVMDAQEHGARAHFRGRVGRLRRGRVLVGARRERPQERRRHESGHEGAHGATTREPTGPYTPAFSARTSREAAASAWHVGT